MDSGFWNSGLAAAKRQYNLHHHHHQMSYFDEYEVNDDVRPDFPCPYCYEDFDIASLSSHLEDEHSCESKITVCPICAMKVAGDISSHINLHHAHLLKLPRRRRSRRAPIPDSRTLSLLGRELRVREAPYLQALLRNNGPFLSSFIQNFPASGADEFSESMGTCTQDSSAKTSPPAHIWKSSLDPCLSSEERERRIKEGTGRSSFVQHLLLSTMFKD